MEAVGRRTVRGEQFAEKNKVFFIYKHVCNGHRYDRHF